jgi:hypothetical protein
MKKKTADQLNNVAEYAIRIVADVICFAVIVALMAALAGLSGCAAAPPKESGWVVFEDTETSWEKPRVGVELAIRDGVYRRACSSAVSFYNDVIGRPFLVLGGRDIVISDTGDDPSHAFTDISYRHRSIAHADIVLPVGVTDIAWVVCAHEIGHALGLAHDNENHFSLMYTRAGLNMALTDYDRRILKERYGR